MKEGKERIIDARTLSRGYMSETDRAFMRKINENPTFDESLKQYRFIKPVKSTSDVHGWIFEFNNDFFVATQKLPWRGAERVDIYNASEKGSFVCTDPIASFLNICDIETAVDKWVLKRNSENGK